MERMGRRQNGKWSSESGSILAASAIGMLAFLLAVGLCVDISHFYLVGTELQNAADAAALAGASALNSQAAGVTEAVNRAVTVMNNYEFNETGVTIERENVHFAINLSEFDNNGAGRSEANAAAGPANIRFIQVTVPPKSVSVFFATLALASNSVNLSRRAVAGQSVALNYICNIAPFSVVQDDTNNPPTPLNVDPGCPNNTVFTQGCTYTLRLGSNGNGGGNGNGNGNGGGNSGGLTGNYLVIAIGSDRGGADVRRRMALGTDSCFTAGQAVSTEPGLTAGPVRQGLNTRFDVYQGGNVSPSEFPPDTNVMENISYANYNSGLAQYTQAPTHPGVPDRRILVVAIVNLSSYDSGRNEVTISRFGAFFLQRQVAAGNGGEIRAEYIGERVVLGDGGYNPGGAPGNPQLTVPVLYR